MYSAIWNLSWYAAREFGKVDAEGFENGQAGLRVGSSRLRILVLIPDQFAGSVFETHATVAGRQG